MDSTSCERSQARRNPVTTRVVRETVVALAASTIMALMVAGGGIAAERMTIVETSALEAPAHEPAPLSWREST